MTVSEGISQIREKMIEGQDKLSARQVSVLDVAAEVMLEMRDIAYAEGRADMAAIVRNSLDDNRK